ncbi:MAG: energy transducer TonB [Hymenobacter sp.]|nr:MAG: energy transducer TonB [Hymenobacter sp.]
MSLLPNVFPASFDDLVFEGRNQAYGAYQLRQAYNGHVRTALSLMIGSCALLFAGSVAWQRLHPVATLPIVTSIPVKPITPPTYVTEAPKSVVPPAKPSQPRMATAAAAPHNAASFPTQIAKDELVAPKPVMTTEIPEAAPGLATTGPTTIGEANGTGSPTGTATGTGEAGSEGGTGNAPAVAGPYVVVEKMPEFAGGMDALMRYLRNHLRYPSAALREQAEGRVYVSFVVQADGTIADITVPKSLGFGLDEEAQRVVSQMPPWTPGRQSNQAVPVRFTLPITFKIQ